MTEKMENALRHIKSSLDVDLWAVEEVERIFRAVDDIRQWGGIMICEKCIHNEVCCDEGKDNEALKYCADFIDIKALQPQNGDTISRDAALKCLEFTGDYATLNEVHERLMKLPSVEPQDGDLISKSDMIAFLQRGREYIGRNRDQYKTASEFDVADEIYVNMIQAVEMMQSVPKTIVNNGTLNIQM